MLSGKISVRFMTLSGKFDVVETQVFDSMADAIKAVTEYVEKEGFTNIRVVDESDIDSIRFTARTPNGRGGRNVAFGDFEYGDYEG